MALHPKVIDLTLDRMWRLLENLGNPQNGIWRGFMNAFVWLVR